MELLEFKQLVYQLNEEVASLLNKEVRYVVPKISNRYKRINGSYNYGTHTLTICGGLVDREIYATILHELCHTYCDLYEGHGSTWQRYAKIVGDHFNVVIKERNNREHIPTWVGVKVIAEVICPNCGVLVHIKSRNHRVIRNGVHLFKCTKCNSTKLQLMYTN